MHDSDKTKEIGRVYSDKTTPKFRVAFSLYRSVATLGSFCRSVATSLYSYRVIAIHNRPHLPGGFVLLMIERKITRIFYNGKIMW